MSTWNLSNITDCTKTSLPLSNWDTFPHRLFNVGHDTPMMCHCWFFLERNTAAA